MGNRGPERGDDGKETVEQAQDLSSDASHNCQDHRICIHQACPGPASGTKPVLSTQAPRPPPFLAPQASHTTLLARLLQMHTE